MPPKLSSSQFHTAHVGEKVGFYGCAAASCVVRVMMSERTKRYPTGAVVLCPACGETHRAVLTWRVLLPRDEGRTPDLLLEAP